MQQSVLDRGLYPAFIPHPPALLPAPTTCPDPRRQADSPVRKRPFTIEFLLAQSPPKVGRRQPPVCQLPVYLEAGCGNYLRQGAGHCWPLYSPWDTYSPDWRAVLPALRHPIPATGRKAKRFRAIFTQEQLAVLESEFKKHHYVIGPQRVALASALGLTVLQVKVWFQNRRIKWKKELEKDREVKTAAGSCRGSPCEDAEDVSTADLSEN